jgi:replicative DNA helicase
LEKLGIRQELELYIIGGIIRDQNFSFYLNADDFSDPAARKTFNIIKELTIDDKKIDHSIALDSRLSSTERLYVESAIAFSEETGIDGLPAKIEALAKFSDLSYGFESLADIRTKISSKKITNQSELATSLESLISNLVTRHRTNVEISAGQSAVSALAEIERMKKQKRIPFGITDVDEFLDGGVKRGKYIVIGARTNAGKSIMSMYPAWEASKLGYRVLCCTNEMTDTEMSIRFLSKISGVRMGVIEGTYAPYGWEVDALDQAVETFSRSGIDFLPHCYNINQIEKALEMRKMQGIDTALVVLDHINRMQDHTGKSKDRNTFMTLISNKIQYLGKKYDCTFVVMAQINRAGGFAERVEAAHIKDCGAIEEDADMVFLLWGDKDDPEHKRHLYLEKNRGGRKHKEWELAFDGATMSLKTMPPIDV